MHAFEDAARRRWAVEINVGAIKRVRGLLDVDLLALEEGTPPLLTRLALDVVLLCDVIFALVKPQADAAEVTDEQFGAGLGGDAILKAQTAFYGELEAFFQGLGRLDATTAIRKQRTMVELAVRRVQRDLEAVEPEAEVESIFGDKSTSSPASAG